MMTSTWKGKKGGQQFRNNPYMRDHCKFYIFIHVIILYHFLRTLGYILDQVLYIYTCNIISLFTYIRILDQGIQVKTAHRVQH